MISAIHSTGTDHRCHRQEQQRRAMGMMPAELPRRARLPGAELSGAANSGERGDEERVEGLHPRIGIVQPSTLFSRCPMQRSLNCCWNRAKNAAVPMNNGMKAITRECSSASSFFEVSRSADDQRPDHRQARDHGRQGSAFSTP